MLNKFPLPEEPSAMVAHFEELKQTILDDVKAQPEYKDHAEFSIGCINNLIAALQTFDKGGKSSLQHYISIIAHLELFNSIFAANEEEEDDFFFDLEEDEEIDVEDEDHHHGGSCCQKKSPCDSNEKKHPKK